MATAPPLDHDGHKTGRRGEEERKTVTIPVARLPVARLPVSKLRCLFFGQRGLILPLAFRKSYTLSTANSYRCSEFVSPTLEAALYQIEQSLGSKCKGNTIYRLANGIYVHVYKNTLSCSHLTLEAASKFFHFTTTPMETLPVTSALNIKPYLHTNADLALMDDDETTRKEVKEVIKSRKVDSSVGKYAWSCAPDMPWGWGENIWTERLYNCLRYVPHVQVVPAYQWRPKTYKSEVATLFPNVNTLPIAPFQGMTDLLLIAKNIAVVHTVNEAVLCIEVGLQKGGVHPITIGSRMRNWPDKIGELLASMYYFGTCHYLNNLQDHPASVSWTSYGILTVRAYGCIALKAELNETGCHVYLLHEGSSMTMGPSIDHILLQLN